MVLGFDTIASVFSKLFDFFTYDIITPVFVLLLVLFFFLVQYLFIRFYIFLGKSGFKFVVKILDYLKGKSIFETLEKLFN